MKKITFLIVLAFALVLAACGSSQTASSVDQGSQGKSEKTADQGKSKTTQPKKESKKEPAKSNKPLSDKEFQRMYSNPKKYKGDAVEFSAKVFVVQKDDKGTYLQAWLHPKNSEGNIIIAVQNPDLNIKENDVIHVKGTVKGSFSGQNLVGGTVTAPVIIASSIKKTDYATAFAPAKKTVKVNQKKDQHGFIVKVNKIELADSETRVYLEVKNSSKSKVSVYSYQGKLTMNGNQYEATENFEAHYPELPSDILPGVTSKGIVVFPALKKTSGPIKLHFEGMSDNFNLNIKPFVFTVDLGKSKG